MELEDLKDFFNKSVLMKKEKENPTILVSGYKDGKRYTLASVGSAVVFVQLIYDMMKSDYTVDYVSVRPGNFLDRCPNL